MAQTPAIDGRVTAVRGVVLDMVVDSSVLPPIDDALVIMPDEGAPLIAEVL
jgi:F-type H+-transporting ATPase subunit beta